MIVKVKFQFLGGLKKDSFLFVPSTFNEEGVTYIKDLTVIASEDSTLNLPEHWDDGGEMLKLVGTVIPMPLYLAAKDLKGYIQAGYPMARVEVVDDNQTN